MPAENVDFTMPKFLMEDTDPDFIQRRMMSNLPPNLDNSEGGFLWDFTMPVAIEKAEMLEYYLPLVLIMMFPQWATGRWLNLHAGNIGMRRREAIKAKGEATFTGIASSYIPEGTIVSTMAEGEESPKRYKTTERGQLDDEGSATVKIEALEPGQESNAAVGRITYIENPPRGIETVTNQEEVSGGFDEEDDETLRTRLLERMQSDDKSYTGNINDYIRWAQSVPGVGQVIVTPLANGPGTVGIQILNAENKPASADLIAAVNKLINSPDNPEERLAPIGAEVTVTTPEIMAITIAATITLTAGTTIDDIAPRLRASINNYLLTAKEEGMIRYNKVGSLVLAINEITDYSDLKINGSTENIEIATNLFPALDVLTITE